ncbi:MAG: 50S ribosomal protein L21 [Candidatus Pacebacteria bacterium]|nr:50S ribosomal protein L21 [Candidatus Paceibacterota bacterium]
MLAIIKTGGKQYLINPGDKIKIEKLDEKEGKSVDFKEVLLVEKNGSIKIGMPIVKSAKVSGKIIKQARAKKVEIFKYKAKKRYKVKRGHRQPYTEVEITKISI